MESGPITIMADGSIDPPTAPLERSGSLYTLTADIMFSGSGFYIQRGGIMLDGDGHVIQGNNVGTAITVAEFISLVTIKNFNITLFGLGICCVYAECTCYNNSISTNGGRGISLGGGESVIHDNTIRDNSIGVFITFHAPTTFYHNNFINNTVQVDTDYVEIVPSGWNLEYSWGGGNYWDDYNGTDLFSGPYQNITGSDGIGDTPYSLGLHVDASDLWRWRDNYPFMQPMGSPRVYRNLCDVNYDLKVDMRDVGKSARAFGTVPGDALWNPRVDVTGPESLVPDGKVDMRDISLIASHYGERYA